MLHIGVFKHPMPPYRLIATILAIFASEEYVRINPKAIIITLVTLITGTPGAWSQDCSSAQDNVLCADAPLPEDSLYSNPVSFDCFSAQMTQFYSITTGTYTPSALNVTITPGDCDSFLGPDSIFIIVVQLAQFADPCDQTSYTAATACLGSAQEELYVFQNLPTESEFLIIIGSDHDPLYGPCTFGVDIGGSSVDVVATVDPFLITLGETTELSASGASSGEGYVWSPAPSVEDYTSPASTAIPEETTTYEVTTTIGECTVQDEVTVTVGPPVVIFNAFTPNGDGINDSWQINGIEQFEAANVNVYDRWGQKIFNSLGYGSQWDGTNRGKFLPAGAYYYVIELNDPDVEIPPLTGVVSILR
ncbi:MAG: gliding motility-associated C-terminal domain-containing protein [Flavobacteriales bacterium]|jgi:gliding motility-associated-like protein